MVLRRFLFLKGKRWWVRRCPLLGPLAGPAQRGWVVLGRHTQVTPSLAAWDSDKEGTDGNDYFHLQTLWLGTVPLRRSR